jgi:hypothetical protein
MQILYSWRDKILRILFRKYTQEIEERYKAIYETYKSTLSIKDVIRERLKGITPKRVIESEGIIQKHLESLSDEDRLAFLSKARQIVTNNTFQIIVNSIILDTEREISLRSEDIRMLDFNRATINGVILIEDMVEELSRMYESEKEMKKRLSEQEKFNPL